MDKKLQLQELAAFLWSLAFQSGRNFSIKCLMVIGLNTCCHGMQETCKGCHAIISIRPLLYKEILAVCEVFLYMSKICVAIQFKKDHLHIQNPPQGYKMHTCSYTM